MQSKRTSLLWLLLCVVTLLQAQAPAGYYAGAKGKSGRSLKTALYAIIADHTARSYNNLWDDFRKTDARADGKVWDMYSSKTNFTFGTDQAGNYKTEGDVYNREHSFPKSWFNDGKPMYTDLFHLVPTDGYVNGRRSNYPFGETSSPKWTSSGGFSRLGPCSTPGYTGTVFEPNDEYKGDFARIYFYMATAYEGQIANWSSPMLAGNAYPAYSSWAIDMLLRWAKEDPVSQKEIDRNNAVYGIQHNRNPYVDFPGLEQYVWGTQTSTAFDPDNYTGGSTTPGPEPEPGTPAAPAFSPAPGFVEAGTEVTLSCATEGAYIYYTLNDGDIQAAYPPVTLTIGETTSISAYSVLGDKESDVVEAVYTVRTTPAGQGVYVCATSTDALIPGTRCLIVCESKGMALGELSNDIGKNVSVTINGQTVETETGAGGQPHAFVLGTQAKGYTFFDEAAETYFAVNSSDNKLHTNSSAADEASQWTVTFSGTTADIANVKYDKRHLRYNASSPRFAAYTSAQTAVSIYVEQMTPSAIPTPQAHSGLVDVYTADGRLLRHALPLQQALQGLPRGLYIVGGTKVLVR